MKRLLATAVVLCAASAALGNPAPSTGRASHGAHPAVVRVIVAERSAVSYGSGTLVGVDQTLGLVVTNWHVIRDAAGPITVVFPDGFRSTATVLAADRHWDLAALAIRRPNVRPVPLASEAPRRGDPLTIAGYGSGWYKASTGRCTQYVSPGFGLPFEMVELDASARQGDSGGPMLNHRGELAGVLFGTGFGRTAGSHSGRVRRFLDTVAGDFQRLSSQSTMIAQRRPPMGAAAGLSNRAAGSGARARPATVAAITGGPHRPPSSQTGRQPDPRRDLAQLPVPRPYRTPADNSAASAAIGTPESAQPEHGRAPVASVSGPGGPTLSPQPAVATRADQIKTFLAAVGIASILLHGMRVLGAAAQA